MKLHHVFSRCTSLIRRRLHALGQKRLPARWRNKVLVEMPTPYLFIETPLMTFITYVSLPLLVLATHETSKHAPGWPLAAIVFMVLFLAVVWFLWTLAFATSTAHARALGDKLFNTPKLPASSATVARLKERQRALRKARTRTKMRL